MLIKLECTPLAPYMLFARTNRPIDQLRRYVIAAKWRQMKSLRRKFGFVGAVLAWPLIAAYRAFRQTASYGEAVRQLTGRSRFRQFCDQWVLAAWLGVPPHGYYLHSLFLPEKRRDAVNYLWNQELSAIVSVLNPGRDVGFIRDKLSFTRACEKAGIPTIPILAVFDRGELVEGEDTACALPGIDIFAKPATGACGRGVYSWTFVRPSHYASHDRTYTTDEVYRFLKDASKNCTYLLQPRLKNHPTLEHLSTGGLCTARLITVRELSGEATLLAGLFKMTTKSSLADNFASGGIACPINLTDGRLGTAAGKTPIVERLTHHPDTGNQITGTTLPNWGQVKEVCLHAHKELSDFTFLGWDVAITQDGPVIVEANRHPCQELLQKGGDCPVGGSAFNRCCLEILRKHRITEHRW